MKMQIAAICFNERELELYVSQLLTQGFEAVSDVKKAEDGSYYTVLSKASKFDRLLPDKIALAVPEAVGA